jgi:hypothetical protein
MGASSLDVELSKYWPLLTAVQKKSLLGVIKSFLQSPERINLEQYNQELSEAEAEYKAGDHISSDEMLQLIQQWQRLCVEENSFI